MSNCAWCGNKNTRYEDFKDDLSRKEFKQSGLCQDCQDATFKEASEVNKK